MELSMIDIGNRIKLRRKELKLTQNDIHRECGIASGALSQIENGSRTPSVIKFYTLSQALNCSMEWLVTGISTSSKNFQIYENEEELLHGFRKLSEEDKEELIEILEMKLRKEKKSNKEKKSSKENVILSDLTNTENNNIAG